MWQVVGQDRVVSLLQRGLEREALAHAYLLVGPPHVGKMTLALDLAKALNCETTEPPCGECAACQKIASAKHADVQVIGLAPNPGETKARTEISIDQIRQVQHAVSLPPFEGKYRAFIIESAESLSNEAANCLLKTLEEPIGKVVFILLAVNDKLLPATVVSRCQRLELTPLGVQEVTSALNKRGVEAQKAELLARLAHGCLGWAISAAQHDVLLEQRAVIIDRLVDIMAADYEERFAYATQLVTQFSQDRGSVQAVLDLWLDWWRDLMLVKAGCQDVITNIDRLDRLVEMAKGYEISRIKVFIHGIQMAGEQLKQNASPRLVFEVLMLDMPEKEERSEANLAT